MEIYDKYVKNGKEVMDEVFSSYGERSEGSVEGDPGGQRQYQKKLNGAVELCQEALMNTWFYIYDKVNGVWFRNR
jgi:hypothetical protein